jgi:hypothetical protein
VSVQLCGCGYPLHYVSPDAQAIVERIVRQKGPNISITVGVTTYLVPRHFIALHGIQGDQVAELAERYGWDSSSNKED